jgi:methylmalonyl-CoA mutase N-terminal domain/subunit
MGVAYYQKDEKDRVNEVTLQSGITVKPVYGPDDLKAAGFDYKKVISVLPYLPFERSR